MKHLGPMALAIGLVTGAAGGETLEERGAYLVEGPMGCGNCHTPMGPDGLDQNRNLAGRLVEKNPAFTAYAPNITPGGPVAAWSDEELARSIREGIRPDGSLIGPPMPYALYRHISDDDLAAVVAYLRALPAVEHEVPRSVYNIPLPPAYGPPVESVAEVPRGVTVAYGEYLTNAVAHCTDCHSPLGPKGRMLETDLGRGGFEMHGPWGVVVTPNITPHADGIAGYSDADLARMITEGVRPDGSPMGPPMGYGYYAKMTPEDVAAVILYLRSLPPLADAG